MYSDWDNSAKNCGANKFVAGDAGCDYDAWNNIMISYNRAENAYYLSVPGENTYTDLRDLEMQLQKLLDNVRLYMYNEQTFN